MGVLYFSEVPLTGVTIEYQPARTVGPPSHQPSREFASQCLQVAATQAPRGITRRGDSRLRYTTRRPNGPATHEVPGDLEVRGREGLVPAWGVDGQLILTPPCTLGMDNHWWNI
jgi:hypothetical protein